MVRQSAARKRTPARVRLIGDTNPFEYFTAAILVGLITGIAALGIVTAAPAFAAGAAVLRKHIQGRTDSFADWWAAFKAAWAGSLPITGIWVGLSAILIFNLGLAQSGALPAGNQVLAVVFGIILLLAMVWFLRAAGLWRAADAGAKLAPHGQDQPPATTPAGLHPQSHSWTGAGRHSLRLLGADLGGTALLLSAVGMCAVLVWMYLPLYVLVPGLLLIAVVSVQHRYDPAELVEQRS